MILFFGDLIGDNIQIFEKVPFIWTWAFLKEIKQDDIVELQSFSLVDGETEGVLQHGRYLRFALLISDYDHLVATKLQRWFLHVLLFTLNLPLLPAAKDIEE